MMLRYFLFMIYTQLVWGINDKLMEREFWIEQKVDHFNQSDTRAWQMRCLESTTFHKPGGPLIIHVNGEWLMTNRNKLNGIFYNIIEELNAYGMQTEHRYYGRSWPVQNLTVENLEYLSVEQAMADLAHTIRFMKATVPELENSKVILLGCSYAGTLVSYFRQLYPDLADGVWAAGAALLFRLDYSDGFVSVGKSIRRIGGDKCYDRLEYGSKKYLQHKKRNTNVYTQLRALNLTDVYDGLHNIITVHVQHRNKSMLQEICKNMTNIEDNDFVGFGRVLSILNSKIPPLFHDKDNIYFDENRFSRQYLYQSCNQFGNFFTTSSMHQPFGNREFFTKEISDCKKYFGPKFTIDYINSKIDETMNKYGGQEPRVDKVYFTKSEDDPWRYTGVVDECARIIAGVGHCHEFRELRQTDPPVLAAAKQMGIAIIRSWIEEDGYAESILQKCY